MESSTHSLGAALTIGGECYGCGCTDLHACQDPRTGEPCSWVAPDLCSVCALLMGGLYLTGEPRIVGLSVTPATGVVGEDDDGEEAFEW